MNVDENWKFYEKKRSRIERVIIYISVIFVRQCVNVWILEWEKMFKKKKEKKKDQLTEDEYKRLGMVW